MRLNSRAVIILILSLMLAGTLLGSLAIQGKRNEGKPEETIVVNEPDVKDQDDDVIPESFLGFFDDGYGIDEDVKKLITGYMDDYYRSIYTLEKADTSKYFDNELASAISDSSIRLLVETRKLHDFDLRMSGAHYDLEVTDCYQEGDLYHVHVLENDHFYFRFLGGIESVVYDIENDFTIRKTEEGYLITDLDKEQGYYLCFHDGCETVQEVEDTYRYTYSQLKDMNSYNEDVLKAKAESMPYIPSKTYMKEYDRNAAVSYLEKYCHERNSEWFNYSDVGGNCQNYASQAMYAGGIPMDFYGDEQWKCFKDPDSYDPEVDESETAAGRSRSWVNVGYFYDYARYNSGSGLVAETGVNIHYAQPGDIIIVGNGTLAHTVMVSKVVDGHILVDSNSIDMKDFPIEAYTYTNVILVKILGYNEYQ